MYRVPSHVLKASVVMFLDISAAFDPLDRTALNFLLEKGVSEFINILKALRTADRITDIVSLILAFIITPHA